MIRNRPGRSAAAMLVALAASLAASTTVGAQAPRRLRALFVGIDHYTYSYPKDPTANTDFIDLGGAVADVGLIKTTLAAAGYLRPGAPPSPTAPATLSGQPCNVTDQASITLTDACATRAAILTALETQIGASQPGDIVLFYFAGHGSTHPSRAGDQVGGDNSTIVPSDSRRPATPDHNDIYDVELKAEIDQAAARGVSVVTIFDSCHSGTATRDISRPRVRSAPDLSPQSQPNLAQIGAIPALPVPAEVHPYRVHLAAASDTEEAYEVTWRNETHGAFTVALAQAIAERPGATYLDIAEETRLRLEQMGASPQALLRTEIAPTGAQDAKVQDSQAEGELTTPFLAARADAARIYTAHRNLAAANTLALDAGALSGVTEGSSFGVYPTAADALGQSKPLATGVVRDAPEPASASLTLDAALPAPANVQHPQGQTPGPGETLVVKEIEHNYGAERLKIAVSGGTPAEQAAVTQALQATAGADSYVSLVPTGPQYRISIGAGVASFSTATGRLIWSGQISSKDFTAALGQVTIAVANYFALLGLRNDNGPNWACVAIVAADQRPTGCPPRGAPIQVGLGDVDMWLVNNSTDSLYRYAIFLNSDTYEISVIDPPAFSNDPPIQPHGQLMFFAGRFQVSGRGYILVLLTHEQINVAALRQDPVRDIATAPKNNLERLLLSAASGQRSISVARTGQWGALAVNVVVSGQPAVNTPTPSQ